MVTLSTLPLSPAGATRRGFRLFVDGQLRGELTDGDKSGDDGSSASTTDTGRNGTSSSSSGGSSGGGFDEPPVTGGDPVSVGDGHLLLCGRSDRDPQRFFSGLLSNLALFSQV
jgi:hypothetical protein